MHYCTCGCGTRITGYNYRCPRGQVWTRSAFQDEFGFLAAMQEVEVIEDLARGDFAAAAFDQAAADDFASGDVFGGITDSALGDLL